jgi:hypothetical protein
MQWPMLGGETGSSFGSPRDGGARRHLGVDIFAPKLTPVVAVADGVATEVNGPESDCCWVKIRHDDGWWSVYVHLNNDTHGTDDRAGNGIRPGLEAGDRVRAGEVIGWSGDSGNAETASPHLHFELRMPNSVPIDPLPSLRWAQRNAAIPSLDGWGRSFSIAFVDDDGSAAETIFNLITSRGAMTPCDEWGVQACPQNPATVLDAATWIGGLTGIVIPVRLPPVDPLTAAENQLVDTAISCQARDCYPTVTVGEAARMIKWVAAQLAYDPDGELPAPPPSYLDLDPMVAWGDLIDAGLATSCPVLPLRAEAMLTRAGLGEMLGQALGLLPALPCQSVA